MSVKKKKESAYPLVSGSAWYDSSRYLLQQQVKSQEGQHPSRAKHLNSAKERL